jgi:hypothetical protein
LEKTFLSYIKTNNAVLNAALFVFLIGDLGESIASEMHFYFLRAAGEPVLKSMNVLIAYF